MNKKHSKLLLVTGVCLLVLEGDGWKRRAFYPSLGGAATVFGLTKTLNVAADVRI